MQTILHDDITKHVLVFKTIVNIVCFRMVDHRRRAERRREYYEKTVSHYNCQLGLVHIIHFLNDIFNCIDILFRKEIQLSSCKSMVDLSKSMLIQQ